MGNSHQHTAFPQWDPLSRKQHKDQILDDLAGRYHYNNISNGPKEATILKIQKKPKRVNGVDFVAAYIRCEMHDTQQKDHPCAFGEPISNAYKMACTLQTSAMCKNTNIDMATAEGMTVYCMEHGQGNEFRDVRFEAAPMNRSPGNTPAPCPEMSDSAREAYAASAVSLGSLPFLPSGEPIGQGDPPPGCGDGGTQYQADFAEKWAGNRKKTTPAKMTPTLLAVWPIVSQLFPPGTRMTSGYRSFTKQYGLIAYFCSKRGIPYLGKSDPNTIESKMLKSGEVKESDKNEIGTEGISVYQYKIGRSACRKLGRLPKPNNVLIVAPNPMKGPSKYGHRTGNAFDIIDLKAERCHLQRALEFINTQREIPIKLSYIWEGGSSQRCFHVNIKSFGGVDTRALQQHGAMHDITPAGWVSNAQQRQIELGVPNGPALHGNVDEPVPEFNVLPADFIMNGNGIKSTGGDHNALIRLGRDRDSHIGTGVGSKGTACGCIDLVVGRQALTAAKDGWGAVSKRPDHDPNFITDAARIYITQKVDDSIDKYFGLKANKAPKSHFKSAVAVKADHIRLIGRESVRIYAATVQSVEGLGDDGETDSNGKPISNGKGKIELVVGNEDKLQPAVLGDKLSEYLKELEEEFGKMRNRHNT